MYPESILTFYSNNFIGHREVKTNGQVGPEKPLYEDTAMLLFKALNGKIKVYDFKYIINPRIKYVKQDMFLKLVWVLPSTVRRLYYTKDKKHPDYTGNYALPNLLFKLHNNKLSVCAIKRFELNAMIYKPPFVNTSQANGVVCMGSAQLDIRKYNYIEDVIEHAEEMFFSSKFSHLKDVDEYVLQGRGKKKYESKWLKKGYLTIKEFINEE